MIRALFILANFVLSFYSFSQTLKHAKYKEDHLLDSLLRSDTGIVSQIYKQAKTHRLQLILTLVHRDHNGNPIPETHTFRLNQKEYFYPASLVKLPISVLALEKINQLADSVPGLSEHAVFITHGATGCLKLTDTDSSAVDFKPHAMHYIKRMLLVSDNPSYSRMYEFCGYDGSNKRMQELCFKNTRIVHRFDPTCTQLENKISNPISFLNDKGDTLLHLPIMQSKYSYSHPLGKVTVGKYHMDAKGMRRKGGKNFTTMNFFPLHEADEFLKRLIFPTWYEESLRFRISDKQRNELILTMSMYPRESNSPVYPQEKFEDSYKKYWLFGSIHDSLDTDSIRICNVVGQSYGFLSDVAYIKDSKNHIEYFLSGCLYVNQNNTMNDGKYQYVSMGFPFFTAFGQSVHRYLISRKGKIEAH